MSYASCNVKSNDSSLEFLNHADSVQYVGISTCASCHPDKLETFQHTGMGLSFNHATKRKSSATFGAHVIVHDSNSGFSYHPYFLNDEFFIKEYRIQNGDTVYQQDVRVDYIVGSGQHTNSHIVEEEGYLYQAPITFYVQEGKWDLAPGFELQNSRFNRVLDAECISCHNSMPKMIGESRFKFEQVGLGIDCERCHGPGSLHVKERASGGGVDIRTETDRTIVNPAKLSLERQIDVCQRCHLQGLNLLKKDKQFVDFKPGMKLSDVFDIYLPDFEGNQDEFDMANHAARFQKSECFIQTKGSDKDFTCITCHNPHISVEHTNTNVYNASCGECHSKEKCSADQKERLAVGDDCVQCHMPRLRTEDIAHVSVHDHYIRKPIQKDEVEKVKRLIGLYAVNNPNPKPSEQIRAYLEYWEKFDKNPFYLNRAKEMLINHPNLLLQLKYYYLTEDYSSAVAQSYSETESDMSAWELFMVGVSCENTNRLSQAVYYLQKAYEKDPTDQNIGVRLMKLYLTRNEVNKAERLIGDLLQEFPKNGSVRNGQARVLIMGGRLEEAKAILTEAYRLEPDMLGVWESYLNYWLRMNNTEQSQFWAVKILKAYPDHSNRNMLIKIADEVN